MLIGSPRKMFAVAPGTWYDLDRSAGRRSSSVELVADVGSRRTKGSTEGVVSTVREITVQCPLAPRGSAWCLVLGAWCLVLGLLVPPSPRSSPLAGREFSGLLAKNPRPSASEMRSHVSANSSELRQKSTKYTRPERSDTNTNHAKPKHHPSKMLATVASWAQPPEFWQIRLQGTNFGKFGYLAHFLQRPHSSILLPVLDEYSHSDSSKFPSLRILNTVTAGGISIRHSS